MGVILCDIVVIHPTTMVRSVFAYNMNIKPRTS